MLQENQVSQKVVEKSQKIRKETKKEKNKEDQKEYLKEIKEEQPFIKSLVYGSQSFLDDAQKLKEFDISNAPTFKAYLDYLFSILDAKQNDVIIQNIPQVLKAFIDVEMPNKVISVYLVFLEKAKLKPENEKLKQQIFELIESLGERHRGEVIKIFKLQPFFTEENYRKSLDALMEASKKSQNYDPAFEFISLFGLNQQDARYLITTLLDNKGSSSKAADYLLKAHIDKDEFPQLHVTLKRNFVNYILRHFKTYEWYKTEDLLMDDKELLVYAISKMVKAKQVQEAYSIVTRNNLEGLVADEEVLKELQICQEQKMAILANPVLEKDDFAPIQDILEECPGKYLSFSDYGLKEEDIVFVNDQNLGLAVADIMKAAKTGLDSEFGGKRTKLDEEEKLLAVLQISTLAKVYLFDCVSLENNLEMRTFVEDYVGSETLIVGHTIEEDVLRMLRHFKADKNTKIVGMVDVRNIYQKKFKEKPYGLASICQDLLGKALSKLDQCSQWSRRPLRRAQMHYAAMDAFSCIQIYDKIQ